MNAKLGGQILQVLCISVGAGMIGSTVTQSVGIFLIAWAIMPQGRMQ